MPTRSQREPSRFVPTGSRTEPPAQLTDTQWFLIEDLFPAPEPTPLWRSALPFASRLSRGNSVCTFVRVPLERFTKIPAVKKRLSPATQDLDESRDLSTRLAKAAGTEGRSSSIGPHHSLGGCHIYPRKKRGDAIGPTKSGKGSKAELLTDCNGTPLHVTLHSASPHETTLIMPLVTSVPYSLPRQTRLGYRPRHRRWSASSFYLRAAYVIHWLGGVP